MPSRRSLPRCHLVGRSCHRKPHHDHGLAQCVHALDHVRSAWRLAVPERHQDITSPGHLAVPTHAGRLPPPLPLGAKEPVGHLMLPRPPVPEPVGTAGATGEDFGDLLPMIVEHPADGLIVRKVPAAGNNKLHADLLRNCPKKGSPLYVRPRPYRPLTPPRRLESLAGLSRQTSLCGSE